jgi:hypothetical protein
MEDLHWIPVAQPLFIARTGIVREQFKSALGGARTAMTEDDWLELRDAAESGLELFCKPIRVYALGLDLGLGDDVRPVYLTADGVYRDYGRKNEEVLFTGETPESLVKKIRTWVTAWRDKAVTALSKMETDAEG